jgi:predicted GNAT family acetyltransferase
MVTLPLEGRWSVRVLTESDVEATLRFLRRDPLINVFLIARVLEERFRASGPIVGVRCDGETVCIASLATNVVMAADPGEEPGRIATAIEILADRILTRMLPVRAIICEAQLVDALWTRLRLRLDPPTVVRMSQPIYALTSMRQPPDLRATRYSTARDADLLVPACAAMHLEEVGIDPLERDAVGYRERIRELIERRQSMVRMEGGRVAFKCEFSAVTPKAVQLMGVWTSPPFRRRGYARESLGEVCGHLLGQGKSVTLFVNDFNTPAIRLYESLGFQRIGTNRALIW